MGFSDTLKLPEIDLRDYRLADYTYEIIKKQVKAFEEALDDDHEVGLRLASFGQSILLNVTDIGYANPTTLLLRGYVNNSPATLVQHVNQLNLLLTAVKKSDPDRPPRRIGFAQPSED